MRARVVFIKGVHGIIFLFFIYCLGYIAYAGLTRTFNSFLLFSICSIMAEGVILWLNGWHCPLTRLAEKYGAENGSVTDILLPPVLARNAFSISFWLAGIELAFLAVRYFAG
jgi:hypothetical protein